MLIICTELKESDDNLCVHIFHLPVPKPWEKCNGLALQSFIFHEDCCSTDF